MCRSRHTELIFSSKIAILKMLIKYYNLGVVFGLFQIYIHMCVFVCAFIYVFVYYQLRKFVFVIYSRIYRKFRFCFLTVSQILYVVMYKTIFYFEIQISVGLIITSWWVFMFVSLEINRNLHVFNLYVFIINCSFLFHFYTLFFFTYVKMIYIRKLVK